MGKTKTQQISEVMLNADVEEDTITTRTCLLGLRSARHSDTLYIHKVCNGEKEPGEIAPTLKSVCGGQSHVFASTPPQHVWQ